MKGFLSVAPFNTGAGPMGNAGKNAEGRCGERGRRSDHIKGRHHPAATLVEHMGIDHRGSHIRVTEEFLHGADVVAP